MSGELRAASEQNLLARSSKPKACSYNVRTSLSRFHVSMMVRLGLARPHVQPCPRNNFELRATSSELRAISHYFWFARGSRLEARSGILGFSQFGEKPGL